MATYRVPKLDGTNKLPAKYVPAPAAVGAATAAQGAKADTATQPTDLTAGLATKVNTSTYTAGLAGKQDTATLAADVAPHVADGSALDTALKVALVPSALPTNVGSRTKRFEPEFGVYNWKDSNTRKWRTALAKAAAATAVTRLNCYGDSVTFGLLVPPGYQNSWVRRVRDRINGRLGATPSTGMSYLWNESRTADDTRFVISGTTSVTNGFGPFQRSALGITSTGKITFTPEIQTDSITIYYVRQITTGRTITVSVDGTPTLVNFDTSGATGTVDTGQVTVSAGSLGNHVYDIASTSAVTSYIVSVEANAGTTGLRISRIGMPSHTAADLALNGTSGNTGYQYAFDLIPPDLSIFFFGHNEYLTGHDTAAYKTAMQTNITRALTTGDVLLMTMVPQSDTAQTPSQDAFNQATYDLADTNDIPLLDVYNRWGSHTAVASLKADATHPNKAGYMDLSAAVYSAIMRGY